MDNKTRPASYHGVAAEEITAETRHLAAATVASLEKLKKGQRHVALDNVHSALSNAYMAGIERGARAWRPIDTAPKNGEHILLADFSRHGFGRINGRDRSWSAVAHWWDNPGEEGFYLSSGNDDAPITWATHWMPVPELAR